MRQSVHVCAQKNCRAIVITKNTNNAVTTNIAMDGEITQAVEVRGDDGSCAGFLP